jgi:hypothetical protein
LVRAVKIHGEIQATLVVDTGGMTEDRVTGGRRFSSVTPEQPPGAPVRASMRTATTHPK